MHQLMGYSISEILWRKTTYHTGSDESLDSLYSSPGRKVNAGPRAHAEERRPSRVKQYEDAQKWTAQLAGSGHIPFISPSYDSEAI